jgi:hypothetical protein
MHMFITADGRGKTAVKSKCFWYTHISKHTICQRLQTAGKQFHKTINNGKRMFKPRRTGCTEHVACRKM